MWWFRKSSPHLPIPDGPYAPGCIDVMLDYSKDGLFMRLFYPIATEKHDPNNSRSWISWLSSTSYVKGIARVLMVFPFVISWFYWFTEKLIPASYGAKPNLDQKLKCVILSHGLGGHRSFYSNLCCELASRGYLVVAVEHRDHSACHTFFYSDVHAAKRDIPTPVHFKVIDFGRSHFRRRRDQVTVRAEECCKAFDFLVNVNDGSVPYNVLQDVLDHSRKVQFSLEELVGKLDLDSVSIIGHSFGGATALLALKHRPAIRQGILLDPWMFPIKEDGLHEDLKQPLIFINTQTFHIATNVDVMSRFLVTDHKRQMFTILHTTHEHQTDSVLMVGTWLNWFMKKLEPLVALKINSSLVLQFLDTHVGSPTPIEDCLEYIQSQSANIEAGLTKPWA